MTPVQQAIRAKEVELTTELEAALRRCRNQRKRSECVAAYAPLFRMWQDVIGQQHGLPPMLTPVR